MIGWRRILGVVLLGVSLGGTASAGERERLQAATTLTYATATRSAGIAALDSLLGQARDPRPVRLALARALAWNGRFAPALAHYDALLQDASGAERLALTIEKLQVLLWQGKTSEARAGYQQILTRDPANVDAQLGLARAARWSGHPLAAHQLASTARAFTPYRPDVREELAAADVDLGLGAAARDALQGEVLSPSGDLGIRLRRLLRPSVILSPVYSDDSFGITRLAARSSMTFAFSHDAHLSLGVGTTHVEQGRTVFETRVAGLAVGLSSTHVALVGGIAAHLNQTSIVPDAEAGLRFRFTDGVSATLGVRHRPFTETAGALATDQQAFYGAGVGGAVHLDAVTGLHVDEAKLALQTLPFAGAYLYMDGRVFQVSDANHGYALAFGSGVDVLRALAGRCPLSLFARWDAFLTGFGESQTAYFSPAAFDAQGIGASMSWRMRPWFTLLADGGRTFSFRSGSAGWFGGGGLNLESGPCTWALQTEVRDDLYYRWRRAWTSVALHF